MAGWSALGAAGLVGAALGVVLPVVPVGVGADVLPDVPTAEGSAGVAGVGEGVGSAGCAAGALGVVAGVLGCAAAAASAVAGDAAGDAVGDAAGDALAVAPPPAAFSKSIRCVRNSTSLALIVGSTPVVPDVPTAPAAPGAGAGAGDSSARWSPTSAFRFAWTFAYDARHSLLVVISSLKFEISCETCVRASPVSCAAAGSWVSWLRLSRAAVKCRLTASVSTDAADGGCCSGCCCAAGAAGSVGVGVAAGLGLLAVGG